MDIHFIFGYILSKQLSHANVGLTLLLLFLVCVIVGVVEQHCNDCPTGRSQDTEAILVYVLISLSIASNALKIRLRTVRVTSLHRAK